MKQFNKLLVAALVISAASFTTAASAATNETAKSTFDHRAQFAHSFSLARRITPRIDYMIERSLNFQIDIAVAAMYEAPTSIAPIEVQLDL